MFDHLSSSSSSSVLYQRNKLEALEATPLESGDTGSPGCPHIALGVTLSDALLANSHQLDEVQERLEAKLLHC